VTKNIFSESFSAIEKVLKKVEVPSNCRLAHLGRCYPGKGRGEENLRQRGGGVYHGSFRRASSLKKKALLSDED